MDLLHGYGSSESDDDSEPPPSVLPTPQKIVPATSTAEAATSQSATTSKRGKRILSLGAVLPPEIFDRLTKPADADDSSTSSFEGGDDKRSCSKKRKRKNENNGKDDDIAFDRNLLHNNSSGTDRTELTSFLSELRSTPMEKRDGSDAAKISQQNKSQKLGMAFMSYTETKHSSNEVVDVHAVTLSAPKPPPSTAKDPNLQKKNATAPSLSFSRISTAAPVVNAPPPSQSYNNIPEYYVPQETQQTRTSVQSDTTHANNYNPSNSFAKSRKQRREEERALRSGAVFHNSMATTEIHQPSPTEFAPTAHAAAIASRAARYRGVGSGGGGGGAVNNISMYDPQAGTDVSGQGITGKHRSKHQINSLMANAISLEAHRAAESELARLGGGQKGGTSSRADAKRKYGW